MPTKNKKNKSSAFKKICRRVHACSTKAAVLLCSLIIISTIIFLYFNCYIPVAEINVVATLKQQVVLNVIDIEAWEKINKNIEWKKQPLANKTANNPFK